MADEKERVRDAIMKELLRQQQESVHRPFLMDIESRGRDEPLVLIDGNVDIGIIAQAILDELKKETV